jgi:hypothetical protein
MGKRQEMEGDFQIDENRLDDEWVLQPRLHFKYGAELANARLELDRAKSEAEVCKAEFDQAIRLNPDHFGLSKITETVVASTIVRQPKMREVNERVAKLKHKVDVMQAAVSAMDHRKSALGKLVDLFLADYYAKPKASSASGREATEEYDKRAARTRGKRRDG